MKKRIIAIIILLAVILISSGLIYLNNVYLPTKAKAQLISVLSGALDCKVEIAKLKYNPFRGLVIQNLVAYKNAPGKSDILLEIDQAHFNFLFLPLFKERKIIIPTLYINSLKLNLIYQKDGSFNISKIIDTISKPKNNAKNNISLLIYKIVIAPAKITFTDKRQVPEFTRTIENASLGIGIKHLTLISVMAQGRLPNSNNSYTKFKIQGSYNFLSKEAAAQADLDNINLVEYNCYATALPFAISAGTINNASLNIRLKDHVIDIGGTINTKNLQLSKDNFSLAGDINILPKFRYNFTSQELDYSSNLSFIGASISGIPVVAKLDNIAGLVSLKKDLLTGENITLRSSDSDINLNIRIEDFKNPRLKINAASDNLNLDFVSSLLPQPNGIKIEGTAKAKISVEGLLDKKPLDIAADLQLNKTTAKIPALSQPLSEITGKISLSKDSANWKNILFNYSGRKYSTTGELLGFSQPRIKLDLFSDNIAINSDMKINGKIINLTSLNAKAGDSALHADGTINTQEAGQPYVDLKLDSNIRTKDILGLIPTEIAQNIAKAKLDAALNLSGSIEGNASDFKNLNISLKSSSDYISIYGLKLSGISFNIIQKNKQLRIPDLAASAYSGKINVAVSSLYKPDGSDTVFIAELNSIDLSKLKLDTDLKDKEISGILNAKINLRGLPEKADSIQGYATVSVANGKLWQMNLFKGLGDLFLMPEYSKITFNQAYGEFQIENKLISTNNFSLDSDQITLDISGHCGFDGALDLAVYSKLNKDLIQDSADMRKFTTAILGQISQAITVKIGGTIQKPTYKMVPAPMEIINTIKNFFLGK